MWPSLCVGICGTEYQYVAHSGSDALAMAGEAHEVVEAARAAAADHDVA